MQLRKGVFFAVAADAVAAGGRSLRGLVAVFRVCRVPGRSQHEWGVVSQDSTISIVPKAASPVKVPVVKGNQLDAYKRVSAAIGTWLVACSGVCESAALADVARAMVARFPAMPKQPNIALVGDRGAGKSSVLRCVAEPTLWVVQVHTACLRLVHLWQRGGGVSASKLGSRGLGAGR